MEWIASQYDLWRGLHIIAVIAWMAGNMYLPRLFAYHVNAAPGSELDITLSKMERGLLKIIMNTAMTLAFVFGGLLIIADGVSRGWSFLLQPWMIIKLAGAFGLAGWHGFLAGSFRAFQEHRNTRSERFWRMTNEIPFLVAIVMVLAVTLEFWTR